MPSLSLFSIVVAAAASIVMLTGCPQERPGSEREMPAPRVSPAPLAVQPEPSSRGAPPSDGGVGRHP